MQPPSSPFLRHHLTVSDAPPPQPFSTTDLPPPLSRDHLHPIVTTTSPPIHHHRPDPPQPLPSSPRATTPTCNIISITTFTPSSTSSPSPWLLPSPPDAHHHLYLLYQTPYLPPPPLHSSFPIWMDDVQAMMDADYELAAKLQAEEQGEISIEERSKLFVELMNERKKHFARLRAEEQRRKPLTKAQKRNQMSNYLKNMAGYTLRFTLKALGSIRRSSEMEIILRLFEPDTDDELWKLQKHIHDLTWKLYDSCEVHHVSIEKGIDIYMLVEKEYPLSRRNLTLMMVANLLVDQDNEMSKELLRKIFM
ncbi:hypothetical protein Tco_1532878 [Tanacetum coccineum]